MTYYLSQWQDENGQILVCVTDHRPTDEEIQEWVGEHQTPDDANFSFEFVRLGEPMGVGP